MESAETTDENPAENPPPAEKLADAEAEADGRTKLLLNVGLVTGTSVEAVDFNEDDDRDDNDEDTLQMAQDWLNAFTSSTTHF